MIIAEIIISFYMALYTLYNFTLSIAGRFRKIHEFPPSTTYNKIAIFIPAYKEDGVIFPVAQHAISQNYPSHLFDIYVIADSLQTKTLEKLAQLPIKVITVSFEVSTKTKALNAAFSSIKEDYEIAIILDADNLMGHNYLNQINDAYNSGHQVIQTKRVAKNKNTPFAILDGISEGINNHISRKGRNALGLSATLIGSGMVFNYNLLKTTLNKVKAVGGFDRELQIRLIREAYKIFYMEQVLTFDEKVEKPDVFQNQRKRWMSSQFVYLRNYFTSGIKGLIEGKLDFFSITILDNMFLPRILSIGLLFLLTLLYLIFDSFLTLPLYLYLIFFGLNIATIVLAFPKQYLNNSLWGALFSIPRASLIMFTSIFGLKGANQKFIHTPHSVIETENQPEFKKE